MRGWLAEGPAGFATGSVMSWLLESGGMVG